MQKKLVAGVDCSTQSTKVLVVEIDSGEVIASGRVSHNVYRDGQQMKLILTTGGMH